MKLHLERKNDTQAILEIAASTDELAKIKTKTLKLLSDKVKVAGFRSGKIPLEVVEKNVDQQTLQTEFINEAINMLYIATIKEERLRPVGQPKVEVTKFVPFTVLEFTLDVPVVGEIILPENYDKRSVKRKEVKVGKKEIDEVLKNLATRMAEKNEVKRAAKDGDEAWIDFKGVDAKGKKVEGADGKDYPLALGSGSFIPGFEDKVIGMKAGEEKEFKVTFPKDYGAKKLQGAKVTFTVTVKKVMEVTLPKQDDDFAAKVGPFKSMDELVGDIRKQLENEQKQRNERDYEAALVNDVTDKSKVVVPDVLVEEQKEAVLQEVRQGAIQRGTTFQEFLDQQDLSEEEFIKKEVVPEANRRVKAGLILTEIGDHQGIDVSPEELEARIQQMKGQYQDKQMQEQLETPEARREINSRLRSEKVIAFLKM